MPLVGTTEMFKKAYDGHYAIGAFNVNNMEIIQGIMAAAKEKQSPVILQASEGARNYAGQEYIVGLIKIALQDYPEIPTALHLDHGSSFEICKACIDGGFTSVMYDGSKHSFEENVRITKEVVAYAHNKGVVVEAELGRLAGVEDLVSVDAKDAIFTDPDQAAEFVELTGCDSLAIAIRKAARMAVCKINIDTDIRLAMTAAIRESIFKNPENFDPRGYLKPAGFTVICETAKKA